MALASSPKRGAGVLLRRSDEFPPTAPPSGGILLSNPGRQNEERTQILDRIYSRKGLCFSYTHYPKDREFLLQILQQI